MISNTISERLDRELPGLHGFSARNLRYMRSFYEEWKMLDKSPDNVLALASAKSNLISCGRILKYWIYATQDNF